jgi:hypothetical protein
MSKRREVHRSVALVFPFLSLAVAVGCSTVTPDAITTTAQSASVSSTPTDGKVINGVGTSTPTTGNASETTVASTSTKYRPPGATTVPAKSATTYPTGSATTVPAKSAITSTITTDTSSTSSKNPTALQVLATIPIMNEYSSGYSRDLFKHWIDADGDGCNTREEVLIAESLTPAQVDAYGCKVIEGDWYSPFDNVTHTLPGGLDIDHMVPLKEAWDSGAWAWTSRQRELFANDLSDRRPLIAVTAGVNRSKGEKDPSNWLPPNSAYLCTYLSDWVAIKAHWKLSMDQSEHGRVKNLLTASCATTTVKPWGTKGDTTGGVEPSIAPSAAPSTSATTPSAVPTESTETSQPNVQTPESGVRQVSPVRCKASEFGQTGEYKGIAYVCSNTRQNGEPYATNYYFWRPA